MKKMIFLFIVMSVWLSDRNAAKATAVNSQFQQNYGINKFANPNELILIKGGKSGEEKGKSFHRHGKNAGDHKTFRKDRKGKGGKKYYSHRRGGKHHFAHKRHRGEHRYRGKHQRDKHGKKWNRRDERQYARGEKRDKEKHENWKNGYYRNHKNGYYRHGKGSREDPEEIVEKTGRGMMERAQDQVMDEMLRRVVP